MNTENYENNSTKAGIYRIKNNVNGKSYIGSTRNFRKRKSEHLRTLINNTHHSILLQRAYNKYGVENFIFEVVELCNIVELLKREQWFIDNYEVSKAITGYNICPIAGSPAGKPCTEEHKAKISKSKKGQRIGIIPDNLESIRYMTKRSVDEYYKGIKTLTYESASEAGRAHNINYKSINNACRYLTPNMERVLPGYTFRYTDGGIPRELVSKKDGNKICRKNKLIKLRGDILQVQQF